jgi:hypothetical protein
MAFQQHQPPQQQKPTTPTTTPTQTTIKESLLLLFLPRTRNNLSPGRQVMQIAISHSHHHLPCRRTSKNNS